MKDIIKAWLFNGTVVGTVSVADADAYLKLLLLALTCIYTLKKIIQKDRKKDE